MSEDILRVEWAYVQDRDGRYYIARNSPDLYKDIHLGGWMCDKAIWIRVSPLKENPPYIQEKHFIINPILSLIDFSTIPLPEWEDKYPIIICQTMAVKTSYYLLNENSSNK